MGATAALAVVAGGTAMSTYGQIKSGRDTNKLFQDNARIAELQAQDAEARGVVEEKQSRRLTEKVIGAQRTSLAGQGVDVNRGSALDVQADAAYLGELDALTIKNNAAKEAWGYRMQAKDLSTRGKNAQREGEWGAYTTILGSGGSLLLAKYGGSRTPAKTSKTSTAATPYAGYGD